MMNGGNGVFLLLTYLPMLLYLAVIVFGIYFVFKVIQFMNTKTALNKERNEKIDTLIKVINQNSK